MTYTYYSPKIRAKTNLFKNTKINIAFRPATTTEKFLRSKHNTHQNTIEAAYTR
jgi:hypothetical protein